MCVVNKCKPTAFSTNLLIQYKLVEEINLNLNFPFPYSTSTSAFNHIPTPVSLRQCMHIDYSFKENEENFYFLII